MRVYGSDVCFNYIFNGLHSLENSSGHAFEDKWLTLADMGHVATYYNRVVVELTNHKIGISETFFPISGRSPLNPKTNIMCLDLIPNHFVLVFFFKYDCPMRPSFMEWKLHKSEETSSRNFEFLDQQTWFQHLMNIHKLSP